MKSLSFFVAGIPKGQPRPRAFARKFGNKFSARVYDPGTAEGWKGQVALAWQQVGGDQFIGALSVEFDFWFLRPPSHLRKNGELTKSAPRFHQSKPDCDNAAKAVLDALTQVGAWRDDAQVATLIVRKGYVSSVMYVSFPSGTASRVYPSQGCYVTIKELEASNG